MLFSLKNLAKSSSCCYRTKSLGLVSGIDSTSLPFSTASSSVATIPSKDIVVSFKQWFKSGHNLFLHQIFQILKATDDADRFRDSSYDVSFHHRADLALSHLDLRLMGRAYAVWIGDLAKVGRLDQALEFLLSKQSLEGYVPDVCRYNILISELLREARLEEVCDLILEMKEREVSPDRVTMNVVLCFFCKVGLLDIAVELYNSRSEFGLTPNSMAYNYLINTFCGNGSADEAYKMLECSLDQGYFPGRKTFSILADALCREGKLDKMKQLVLFALERNLMPSGSTYDKFIATLCRTNRVDDAYLIYEQLIRISEASLVCRESTYVSLINSFCMVNKGEIAARLLIEMQQHGHLPNHKVFRDVICSLCNTENPDNQFMTLLEMQLSCQKGTTRIYNYFIYGAGHARRPDLARKVLQMMQQSGIVANLRTDVLMLHSYLKKEKYLDALNYFNDLRQRRNLGRRLYSLMIMGMSKARKPDFALALLEEMREKGIVPSNNCYEFLIQSLCWNNEYDTAVSLINDLEKVGRQITSFIGNILLLNSLKSQELYKAWVRLRDLQIGISDNSILGLLIGAFSGRIWVSQQIENLEEVIANCFPLDVYTYNLLLRNFTNSNMDHACALFYRMSQKGYEPNRWTYDILVQGFLKHGRTDEANLWLKAMYEKGFSPTEQRMRFD